MTGFVRSSVHAGVGSWVHVRPFERVCVCAYVHASCVRCLWGETGNACGRAYAHLYIDTFNLHILHTSYMKTSQNKKTRRGAITVLVVLKSAEVFGPDTPTREVSLPLCVSSLAMSPTHIGVGVRAIYLIPSQTPKAP